MSATNTTSLKRLWAGLRFGWSEVKPVPETRYSPSQAPVIATMAEHTLEDEIRRLRAENAELRADLADAKYRENYDGY